MTEENPQQGETPAEATGGQDGPDLSERVAELEDRLLRTAAELENYKRRREREVADLVRYATEPLVRSLVPILDAFEQAVEADRETKEENQSAGTGEYQALHDGVELILQQLLEALRAAGVERDFPDGHPFDPHRHEAVSVAPDPDVVAEHVSVVVQAGYLLNDRVVRPARVVVSSGPSASSAERESEKASVPEEEKPADEADRA